MLQHLFAKKNYPELEKYLPQLLQNLALTPSKWMFKQQTASYQHPYRYLAQGQGWTLSFYENALKESIRMEQTELVLTCKNVPWLTLFAQSPQQQSQPSKQRLDVAPLPENEAWFPWKLQSNNQGLAEEVLATSYTHLSLFQELEAVELTLERQRLYIKWPCLPTTTARQQQLRRAMEFAQALTAALDQGAISTAN